MRLENEALEGAITFILDCATSTRLVWTGFSLDEDERRAVYDKALMLYRRGVGSMGQMEEDGVSTVVRLRPPFSIFRQRALQ